MKNREVFEVDPRLYLICHRIHEIVAVLLCVESDEVRAQHAFK